MAVKSTTFGGVTLSGEEAKAFRRQINEIPVKHEAKQALERGRAMMDEFSAHGSVKIAARR